MKKHDSFDELMRISQNIESVFSCSDEKLRAGSFEEESIIDLVPVVPDPDKAIQMLLRLRALVRARMNIGSRAKERIKPREE